MAGQDWTQRDIVTATMEAESAASSSADASSGAEERPDPVAALLDHLRDSITRWDFFSAVRHLECTARHLPRMGHAVRPIDEIVRFGQLASLNFAPSDLVSLMPPRKATADDGRALPRRFLVNFFGLLGPNGPMPLAITEHVRRRQLMNDDPTLAEFLDIFHHRMLTLFYRAWASTQQAVQFERHGLDRFSWYVGSLFGDAGARQEPDGVVKLHYAGRLISQPRNAEGLEGILRGYFGVPAELDEFIGQWQVLPQDFRCQLKPGALNTYMGTPPDDRMDLSSAIVGSRIWDCQQKAQVRMGPLTYEQFERLLPPGESLGRLIEWVHYYAGNELLWDLRLVLAKEEVPGACLGKVGRLGWTTWLKSEDFKRDADDLVLSPAEAKWRAVYQKPTKSAPGRDMIHALEVA